MSNGNRITIGQLNSGPELNAIIGKMIGAEPYQHIFHEYPGECIRCSATNVSSKAPRNCPIPPDYSVDETAAFEVLRWLNRKFGDAGMRLMWDIEDLDEEWCVTVSTDRGQSSHYYQIAEVYGPVALAICGAAMIADEWDRSRVIP